MANILIIPFWVVVAGAICRYVHLKRSGNWLPDQPVKVIKCSHNIMAEHYIEKYLKKGYKLENHSTRKAAWSPLTGIFTAKQIHTLTFIKD